MIDTALQLLRIELEAWLKEKVASSTEVVLENIAQLETEQADERLTNSVVISLVNIEEESTLKNGRHVHKTGTGVEYRNTPIHLNLYLLFCANYPDRYTDALMRLSGVIRFFQGKTVFSFQNSPLAAAELLNQPGSETDEIDEQFKLILELYTLTFEQINHLWGSLGGRQLPSAMYKARLVQIQDRDTVRTGPLIEEIETRFQKL